MKRVGILYHPMNQRALPLAEKLEAFLGGQGATVWRCSAWEGERARCQLDGTDLIVTVGGDGTILRAVQVVAGAQIPIVGVNLGRLGFMTELSVEESESGLLRLLAGEGWLDERAMLRAEYWAPGKKNPLVFEALNDVVVARGEIVRMIHIEASIDDAVLTTYKADGMIVASATGSTGYALSAGGAILPPGSAEMIMLPILPHLSFSYPVVLPAAAVMKLRISVMHQATLSIDGHINLPVPDGAVVEVSQSDHKTRFLRIHPEGAFYGFLERRLKGKR